MRAQRGTRVGWALPRPPQEASQPATQVSGVRSLSPLPPGAGLLWKLLQSNPWAEEGEKALQAGRID